MMNHEKLVANLRVLADQAKTSEDSDVRHASVVLLTLMGALHTGATPLLSSMAMEFSSGQLVVTRARNEG